MFEKRLLERLSDSTKLNQRSLKPDPELIARSVQSHLVNLLNTRQGSVLTLPDYGLPDFNDMVSRFPDAILELRREIRRCIENYEPRLSKIRVAHLNEEDIGLNLRFEITALLNTGDDDVNVWFETTLDSSGKVKIRG